MKIYIVIWEDRHSDTTATPFKNFVTAKKWAKEQALQHCHDMEDFSEKENISGWLYRVGYSCEGDSLWITEHEI